MVSEDPQAVYLEGTETLAGSCCSLLDVFWSMTTKFGVSVGDAAQMLATTPARIARLDHVGAIAKGRRADLALFNQTAPPHGDGVHFNRINLKHVGTMVAGEVVYKA